MTKICVSFRVHDAQVEWLVEKKQHNSASLINAILTVWLVNICIVVVMHYRPRAYISRYRIIKQLVLY